MRSGKMYPPPRRPFFPAVAEEELELEVPESRELLAASLLLSAVAAVVGVSIWLEDEREEPREAS